MTCICDVNMQEVNMQERCLVQLHTPPANVLLGMRMRLRWDVYSVFQVG